MIAHFFLFAGVVSYTPARLGQHQSTWSAVHANCHCFACSRICRTLLPLVVPIVRHFSSMVLVGIIFNPQCEHLAFKTCQINSNCFIYLECLVSNLLLYTVDFFKCLDEIFNFWHFIFPSQEFTRSFCKICMSRPGATHSGEPLLIFVVPVYSLEASLSHFPSMHNRWVLVSQRLLPSPSKENRMG